MTVWKNRLYIEVITPRAMKAIMCLLAVISTCLPAAAARDHAPKLSATDSPLYSIRAVWHSDAGKEVALESLRGQPLVVALFFTRCPESCPLMIKDLKAIDAALPDTTRQAVNFLLISIDPDRDTPEVLQAYRAKSHLPDSWLLFNGPAEGVNQVATALGFKYVPGSTTNFGHSLLVTILDRDGRIAFQQAGVEVDRREAIKKLRALAMVPKRH